MLSPRAAAPPRRRRAGRSGRRRSGGLLGARGAPAKLAEHAHTVAVDQAAHRAYFPLQDIGGHPVLRIMEPTK